MSSPFIPTQEYERIIDCMPICCVDFVIKKDGQFLLSLRKNDPAKGQWFPVGGRIYKGETLTHASQRKLQEEIGIKLPEEAFTFLMVGETLFQGMTTDQNRHSVNVVYIVELNDMALTLDAAQLEEVAWFSSIDASWDPYVREILAAAGFSQ